VTDRLSEARRRAPFDRGLVAQGVANMVCPFFGAPPGVAMLARTVASKRAGAVSRWSVLAHSLVLLLFSLPLSSLISQIPLAVLAAVTVTVGLQLIDLEHFRALRQMNYGDAALFLLTFALVIFSDLIVGVGVGSLVAMLRFSFKHGSHKLFRRTTYRTVSTTIQEESNHDQSANYRSM
jgi:MFS superfamily sulfate permease-like transporter